MNTEHENERSSDAALDQALNQALRQLPKEMHPAVDLWPRLQPRLTRTSPRRMGMQIWPFAAAAVLAALWLAPWPELDPVAPGMLSESAPEAQQERALNSAGTAVEIALVQTYEQQKAQQLAGLRSSTGLLGDWQAQLTTWDNAVSQVRYALTFYPDEPQLLTQLDMLYRQQLTYLQQVALAETSQLNTYY